MTREEVINLLLNEFAYWRDQTPADDDAMMIQMGGMASVSNVLAAVMGRPAKWHHSTLPLQPGEKPGIMLDLHCRCGSSLEGFCGFDRLNATFREWHGGHHGEGHGPVDAAMARHVREAIQAEDDQ